MRPTTARESDLIEAARAALRWFHNRSVGNGRNRANDDVFAGRRLFVALERYDDVPPVSDADRQRPITQEPQRGDVEFLQGPDGEVV